MLPQNCRICVCAEAFYHFKSSKLLLSVVKRGFIVLGFEEQQGFCVVVGISRGIRWFH